MNDDIAFYCPACGETFETDPPVKFSEGRFILQPGSYVRRCSCGTIWEIRVGFYELEPPDPFTASRGDGDDNER